MSSVLLVFLAAFSRLVPHWPNVTAVGGLALFSGARLRRGWAFGVPLLAMALSDLLIDFGSGRPVLSPVRLAVYASLLAAVALGRLLRPGAGLARFAGVTLGASTIFFLVTNFAVWLGGYPVLYPHNAAGLLLSYTAALPFFRNEVLGDLAWVGLLFGLEALARRAVPGAVAPVTLESGREER